MNLRKLAKLYFYWDMCYQTGGRYLKQPINWITDVIAVTTVLKIWNLTQWWVYVALIPVGAIWVVGKALAGRYFINRKVPHIESSIKNQLNPHMMAIYKHVKKDKDEIDDLKEDDKKC